MAKYVTKQRIILQEYLSHHVDKELSAKKVAQDLLDSKLSLSAIYRNLADMEKEQLVVQCHKEGSREFYFRFVGVKECQESLHLSCRVCKEIVHISPEDSVKLQEQISQDFSFSLDLPNTVLYGTCRDCQK
ncbi:MAG: transcriptional repressor [Eubacteriales bacterium]